MKRIIVTLLTLVFATPALAGSVTLAWTASETTGITGYRIYQSILPRQQALGSGNHVAEVLAGTTKYELLNITTGRYCWVVTAFSGSAESAPSNEVCADVGSSSANPENSALREYVVATLKQPDVLTIVQIGP